MFKSLDTHQEGMDILMFRETGMVGLQPAETRNITIQVRCTKQTVKTASTINIE